MGRLLVVTSTMAVLLVGIPPAAEPGGPFGIGRPGGMHHGRGFHAPHGVLGPSLPRKFSPFPSHHRPFARRPFGWGVGVVAGEPAEVHVVAVPVPAVQPVPDTPPAGAPAPDPKFVFPPSPGAEPSPGRHAVIVQHGSRIEVISFPIDR